MLKEISLIKATPWSGRINNKVSYSNYINGISACRRVFFC